MSKKTEEHRGNRFDILVDREISAASIMRELLPDFGIRTDADDRLASLYRQMIDDTCTYAFQVPTELPSSTLFNSAALAEKRHTESKSKEKMTPARRRKLSKIYERLLKGASYMGPDPTSENALRSVESHRKALVAHTDALEKDRSGNLERAHGRYEECLRLLNQSIRHRCDKRESANLRWKEVVQSQRISRIVKTQVLRRVHEIELARALNFMVWEKTPEVMNHARKILTLKSGAYVFKIPMKRTGTIYAALPISVHQQAMPVTFVKFPGAKETTGTVIPTAALKVGIEWYPLVPKRTPILLAPAVPCIILHDVKSPKPRNNFIALLFPSSSAMDEINQLEYFISDICGDAAIVESSHTMRNRKDYENRTRSQSNSRSRSRSKSNASDKAKVQQKREKKAANPCPTSRKDLMRAYSNLIKDTEMNAAIMRLDSRAIAEVENNTKELISMWREPALNACQDDDRDLWCRACRHLARPGSCRVRSRSRSKRRTRSSTGASKRRRASTTKARRRTASRPLSDKKLSFQLRGFGRARDLPVALGAWGPKKCGNKTISRGRSCIAEYRAYSKMRGPGPKGLNYLQACLKKALDAGIKAILSKNVVTVNMVKLCDQEEWEKEMTESRKIQGSEVHYRRVTKVAKKMFVRPRWDTATSTTGHARSGFFDDFFGLGSLYNTFFQGS